MSRLTKEQELIKRLAFAAQAYLIFTKRQHSESQTYNEIAKILGEADEYLASLDVQRHNVNQNLGVGGGLGLDRR